MPQQIRLTTLHQRASNPDNPCTQTHFCASLPTHTEAEIAAPVDSLATEKMRYLDATQPAPTTR